MFVHSRYWDTVLEMSWPRFTYVVELNVDSVRNTDPQKLGVIDIRPHYVSKSLLCIKETVVLSYVNFPFCGTRAVNRWEFRSPMDGHFSEKTNMNNCIYQSFFKQIW